MIEFFQRALKLEYERPLDLLYFATGALYLGTRKSPRAERKRSSEE